MRSVVVLLVATGWFVSAAAAAVARAPVPAAEPVKVSKAVADTLREAYARDRAQTEKDLKESPTSYLAAVARKDFGRLLRWWWGVRVTATCASTTRSSRRIT